VLGDDRAPEHGRVRPRLIGRGEGRAPAHVHEVRGVRRDDGTRCRRRTWRCPSPAGAGSSASRKVAVTSRSLGESGRLISRNGDDASIVV
jgi:hypothetical protein